MSQPHAHALDRTGAFEAESDRTANRTYVVDTSVLLSDPRAMFRFAEHAVVLPLVVLTELEKKRHDPDLGVFARRALRELEALRTAHERLDVPLPITDNGGTLHIEMADADPTVLPAEFRLGDNDTRILAVAMKLATDGVDVSIVSKDLPLRLKAASLGLGAEEYRAEQVASDGYTGMSEVWIDDAQLDDLFAQGTVNVAWEGIEHSGAALLHGTGVVLESAGGSALARVVNTSETQVTLERVHGDQDVFGLRGRSAEQRLAIDLLRDDSVGIVSLGGRAGTGKSALALAAGLDAVFERQAQKKIMVFRPLYAVGGQELGYLPGDSAEKMHPWAQAVFDTLGAIASENVRDEIAARDLIEVLPLTHIRGRTLHDTFIILDEAQSLERNVLLTLLSRVGQGSRVVLTHDVAQRDNLRVGRYDGIAAVIETLKGNPLFGHITLTRCERSAVAALVTNLLDDAS